MKKRSESSQGGFCCIFQAIGNWWEKPCISYVVKYKIGWESNGRKFPILWGKYWYQFPNLSQFKGFHCIVLYYGKLMGKHMHFPYNEVHHRMEISWEKNTYTVVKVWVPISYVLPIRWVLLRFSVLWEIDWKPMHFPCNEVYYSLGIRLEKFAHTMGKVWVTNFQVLPIWYFLLHFPVLREIDVETLEFPMWWSTRFFL